MKSNRRNFLKGAAAGAFFIPATRLFGQELKGPASRQFRFAAIGAGGMGGSTTKGLIGGGGTVVALCDTDADRLATQAKLYPGIPCFRDFREMLAKIGGEIDAVHVSTPDHMHAYPALYAMNMGKHVYVQKPLAHTFEECEMLAEKARSTGLVCQMGNQGHPGVLRYKALLEQNPWGEIEEIESWSDRPDYVDGNGNKRPIWKQGMTEYAKVEPYQHGYTDQLWDIWCGPSANNGYSSAYAPGKWRGWWDYGCGPIGDMAVHNADPAFWLFNLGLPVSILGDTCGAGPVGVAYPLQSVIRMRFAPQPLFPRGVTLTWRDGGLLPHLSPDMNPSFKPGSNGLMIVGSKATTCGASHASSPSLIAAGKHAWNDASRDAKKCVEKLLKDVKIHNHYAEFVESCKDGTPERCGSKFSYAAPLTEALLLGCLSLKFPGMELKFDPKAKRFTNCEAANAMLKAPSRGQWKLADVADRPWWRF